MENQSGVALRFLGPFEVMSDGHYLSLGGVKQRALLAYLALHGGEPVSISRLVQAVWGDGAPDGAVRSLRTYVSNLRHILGPGIELRGERGTYRLELGSASIDIAEFRSAVERAEGQEDERAASVILTSALDIWRGPFLADIDLPWVHDQSTKLDWEHQRAIAKWAETTIEAGDAGRVIPVLEGRVSQNPLDERLGGLLMRALYLSGRQVDALAEYRRLRTALAEDLGVQPGTELQNLEEQILLHDAAIDSAERRWSLPAAASELVGRCAEIEDLLVRIHKTRLLTLTGPGGVGKTRLAMEMGRRFVEDGEREVFFADLSGVFDHAAIDAVLASSVGVQLHPEAGPLTSLIKYLRPRSSILIVDNCEHVARTIARCIATLMHGCPKLTVIATSRSPLHVDGEAEWRTPSLTLPDRDIASLEELRASPSVDLLVRRAPSMFRLTRENAQDVVELCRSLDGLPLALELAGSRLGSMTSSEIVATVESRAQLSVAPQTDRSRHATLEAAVGWSFDLISEERRRLLINLSVMSGWFVLEDVLAVCVPETVSREDVRSQLSTLVDESLVTAETSGTRTRYRLLETIRRFSIARLGDNEHELRKRHASRFAEFAVDHAAGLLSRDEADLVKELSVAYDNMRSAVLWSMQTGDVDSVARIVVSLTDWGFWRSSSELANWALWAWENTPREDSRWVAVCGSAARAAWIGGRLDDALRYGRAAEGVHGEVLAQFGHPDDVIADVALYRGEIETMLEHYSTVAELAHRSGDLKRHIWATYYISLGSTVLQRVPVAVESAAVTLAGARKTGNPSLLSMSLYASGLAVKHQSPSEAITFFEEAVKMAASVGNEWFGHVAGMELAYALVLHGDAARGFREFRTVIDHWQRTGDETQLRQAWRYLARVFSDRRLFVESAVLCGALLAQTHSTLAHLPSRVSNELANELGEAQYRRLTVRGSIMSVSELVVVGLDGIDRALAANAQASQA